MRNERSHVRRALFRWVLVLSVASVAAPSPAFAAAPTTAELNEGRVRFARGVELFSEGNFGAALAEFEAGYRAAPSYKFRYNLARVRYELQDYVGAIADFEAYLREGGDRVPTARRHDVTKELEKLKQRIATLIVRTHEKTAQILVDGAPAGKIESGATTLSLSSGRRRIEVIFPGQPSEIRIVDLAGATETVLDIDPPPPAVVPVVVPPVVVAAPPRTNAPIVEEAPPSRTATYVAFGAAGIFAAGATTFAIVAAGRRSAYADSVAAVNADRDRAERLRQQTRDFALAADVLVAGAVVGASVGIYTLLTRKPQPRVVPAAVVTPHSISGGLSSSF